MNIHNWFYIYIFLFNYAERARMNLLKEQLVHENKIYFELISAQFPFLISSFTYVKTLLKLRYQLFETIMSSKQTAYFRIRRQ